jgi:membrane-associated phospholipid phosphatase
MATLLTNMARAYVNWGRWVADCPNDCGGALAMERGQAMFSCPECQYLGIIEWPGDVDGITEALAERPVPRTRNWFPSGHTLAERFGLPHGQTPAQLREEGRDNGVDGSEDVR